MCTLILIRNVHPNWPLIVASNRDEFFERPTQSPRLISHEPPVYAGQDLRSGGTWLGVTRGGFFAAVTNQRRPGPPQAGQRSRGELVSKVLELGNAADAMSWLAQQSPENFSQANLAFGDSDGVTIAYLRHDWTFTTAPDGISVLPNDELDSPHFPKVRRIKMLLADRHEYWHADVAELSGVLGDVEVPDASCFSAEAAASDWERLLHAVCVRTPQYGTRSSTVIALSPGRVGRYLHADGAPDRTPLQEQNLPRGL